MICVEIFPHIGCKVDGKWIKFGQPIGELGSLFSVESNGEIHFLFDGTIKIETKKGFIRFMEFVVAQWTGIQVAYNGIVLSGKECDETISRLETSLQEHVSVWEDGHIYLLEKADVVCWRDTLLEDIDEMIRDAKEEGIYERMKEDIETDIWKAHHFMTIGIGEEGYSKSYKI